MARTISTAISTGVTLAPTDDPLSITPSGYVSGPNGIQGPLGTSWTIANDGTVLGTNTSPGTLGFGVYLLQGGTITNASTGLIAGPAGIMINTPDGTPASPGSVSNAGRILATVGANLAIYLRTAGQVSNEATGTIEGGWGIKVAGPDATINNQGLISATYTFTGGYGIYLRAGGTVINGQNGPSTATIQGLYGVKIDSVGGSYLGTVQNYGTITGSSPNYAGVGLFQGGRLTNGGSGATAALIQGGRWGVASGLTATITNYATITATGASGGETGVYLGNQAAYIYNIGPSALISGYVGVNVGYGTVTNSGTIASTMGASGTAVNFIATANRLVVEPGAVFVGTVAGGLFNANTIELGGNVAGIISNLGTSFTNFGTVLVDAGATWTMDGSISIKDTATAGAVSIGASADLEVTGALSSADAFALQGGSLHIAGVVDPASSFDLTGAGSDSLLLDSVTGTSFDNAITGFGGGDAITLPGVTFAAGGSATANAGTLSVPLQGGGTFTFSNFTTQGPVGIVVGAHSVQSSIACFVAGTRIRAQRGEVAVEALRAGDFVILTDGRTAPVRWIGHRSIDCRRHARPHSVWPVRVAAGALGVGPLGIGPLGIGLPVRDLMLSPDHAVYLNGVLIPVRLLINHASIEQIQTDRVTYYHVELDRHDLLLAEGIATESYLDTGNREMFENGGESLALHPEFANGQRARELGSCVPFVCDPAQVEPVWRALADRAKATGWMLPEPPLLEDDPDLHVLAGKRRIDPIEVRDGRYAFVLSSGDGSSRLVSRAARACDARPWADDDRRLGVKLRRLSHRRGGDTREMAIDDPTLDQGWWAVEWDHGGPCRWTSGDATLPSLGRGILEVALCGTLRYPVATNGRAVLDCEVGPRRLVRAA